MSKIQQLDRAALRLLMADIDAALAAVGDKYNVALTCGRATFNSTTADIKLGVAVRGAVEGAQEGASAREIKAAKDWAAYATSLGLQRDWLGQSFVRSQDAGAWRIVGLLPASRKYPVLCHNDTTGKSIRFTAETVCVYMQLPVNKKQGAKK